MTHHKYHLLYGRESQVMNWPLDLSLRHFGEHAERIMEIVRGYEPIHEEKIKIALGQHTNGTSLVEMVKKGGKEYQFEGKIHFATESLSFALDTRERKYKEITGVRLGVSLVALGAGMSAACLGDTNFEIYGSMGLLGTSFLIGGYSLREWQRERAKYLELIISRKHSHGIRKEETLLNELRKIKVS